MILLVVLWAYRYTLLFSLSKRQLAAKCLTTVSSEQPQTQWHLDFHCRIQFRDTWNAGVHRVTIHLLRTLSSRFQFLPSAWGNLSAWNPSRELLDRARTYFHAERIEPTMLICCFSIPFGRLTPETRGGEVGDRRWRRYIGALGYVPWGFWFLKFSHKNQIRCGSL